MYVTTELMPVALRHASPRQTTDLLKEHGRDVQTVQASLDQHSGKNDNTSSDSGISVRHHQVLDVAIHFLIETAAESSNRDGAQCCFAYNMKRVMAISAWQRLRCTNPAFLAKGPARVWQINGRTSGSPCESRAFSIGALGSRNRCRTNNSSGNSTKASVRCVAVIRP